MIPRPPEFESYAQLNRINFYRHMPADWKAKHYINVKTHKITSNDYGNWESVWDYVNNDPKRETYCVHAQNFAKAYNMVPPFCVSCWKVVAKPRKLSELFRLCDLMYAMGKEDEAVWCKCGTEHRSYVPGIYGGYFYTDSKSDGLKRLVKVRSIIDMPVVLKRYCTEFERALGDSIDTEERQPEDAKELQDFFFAHLGQSETIGQQARLIKLEVYQGWIDFGWKFGSPEDRKEIEDTYNDGKPLYPKPRTYEE